MKTGQEVAIKVEPGKKPKPTLRHEFEIYKILGAFGN